MTRLEAEAFRQDPRVQQAKRLLFETLEEHRTQIAGIRPPDPERAAEYSGLLDAFGNLRGGALYHPYLGSGLGRGPLVELADGSVKLDFICGVGVHFLGHGHPRLVEASLDAAFEDLVMQGNLQQNPEAEQLVALLAETACRGGAALTHCFLTTSGAMANENALKMVFQKRYPADRLVAFERGFAGRTLALAQVSDRAAYREGLPTVLAVDYVPFFDPDDPAGSIRRALDVLGEHLGRHPGRHAAMVFELIQGEAGAYGGQGEFFRALMGRAREAGLAVMVDEIQTFGRTPEPFAFQYYGLGDLVDVVTVGKLTQVCATLFRDEYRPRPGLVSQTFTGATAAIRAGRAVLEVLLKEGSFGPRGSNARVHSWFADRLEVLAKRHPGWVRGPFGVGAMVAFTPFGGGAEIAKRVVRGLFDAGVIAFTAGLAPTRVRFLVPAPVIEEAHVEQAMVILEGVLAAEESRRAQEGSVAAGSAGGGDGTGP